MKNRKRLFSVLFVMLLIVHSFISTSGIALAAEGKGTASSPYLVKTAADLFSIPANSTSYYKLENNIDLQNTQRQPLGQFSGVFDGGGYTISNLNITGASGAQYIALFSKLEDATIKNITFSNATVSATSHYAGIIAGNAFNTKFINCSITNSKITGNNSYYGFLCGYFEVGTVTNCMTENTTHTGGNQIGSLIGYARRATISDCKVVNPILTGTSYIGSIAGTIYDNTTIKNCAVKNPKIESSSYYSGAICGQASKDVNIINCNSMEGKINATHASYSYAGGLVGYATSNTTIKQCFTTTEINAASQYCGGLIGYADYEINIEQSSAMNIVKGKTYVGGMIGFSPNNSSTKLNITDSYYNGSVTATDTAGLAAGVIASPISKSSFKLNNSYIASKITAKTFYAFAVDGTITDSYFDENLLGITTPAYNSRPTVQMYKRNNYYTWDFQKIWSIDEGKSYPTLRLIQEDPELPNTEDSILKVILEPTEKLKLSVHEEIDENTKVVWSSSDTTVAEVDENGIVKAISRGDAMITAKTSDGFYEELIQVYVMDKASKYRLTIDLDIDEACRLSIDNGKDLKAASWLSNDPSTAAVTDIGRVTAVKKGLVLIEVKNEDGDWVGQVYVRVR